MVYSYYVYKAKFVIMRIKDMDKSPYSIGNPPYFPFTEIIGDWKYEYPQMGTCIGTNLKTGNGFFCEYNPPIDYLTSANTDYEGGL